MVPQRRVFRVYASKLASDGSLGRQLMGAMYHRGSSQIASTSESHGGDLIILRSPRPRNEVGSTQYYTFLLIGVGDKGDGESGTIPEASRSIKDLLQVGGL
ncbi:hypothetical protein B296_00051607 [Ensete ventricosum]|uniref:Uncharacterized protein n=1 Tax=Ensete ventricosum TaxID=4639 RepID=A0A426X6X9_ENSVE|nr:hypothetical protein B296_00051607 [Ensete ventricosum]